MTIRFGSPWLTALTIIGTGGLLQTACGSSGGSSDVGNGAGGVGASAGASAKASGGANTTGGKAAIAGQTGTGGNRQGTGGSDATGQGGNDTSNGGAPIDNGMAGAGGVPDSGGLGGSIGAAGSATDTGGTIGTGGTSASGGVDSGGTVSVAGSDTGGASSGGDVGVGGTSIGGSNMGGVNSGGVSSGGAAGAVSFGGASSGGAASTACVDVTDDAACATALGAGYICNGGSCVQGCRTNGDCTGGEVCNSSFVCAACTTSASCGTGKVCATGGTCVTGTCATSSDCDAGSTAGEICGASSAYDCGSCQSDQECAGDPHYAAANKNICISGKCVTGTCAGGTNATCGNGDACCSSSCVAGSAGPQGSTACCANADCASVSGKPYCSGNVCTSCVKAQADGSGAYKLFVNPATPATNGGTGVDNGTCAFASISRALSFVNTLNGTPQVVIYLTGTTSSNNGEVFPIAVPKNVTIQGANVAGSTVTAATKKIVVRGGDRGVAVAAPSATLSYLDIDGSNGSATAGLGGIAVVGDSASASLDHVTVENMSSHAIIVGAVLNGTTNVGGSLTINAGVTVQNNGTTASGGSSVDGDGLLVRGKGSAVVGGLGLSAPVLFSKNADHAIAVFDAGGITLMGEVTLPASAAATGTVTTTESGFANVYINQTGTGLPTNQITGLLSTNSANGRGVHILGGSKLVLRKSTLLGNATTPGDGLRISNAGANVDVSGIDLGTRGNDGLNTFQVASGSLLGARNAAGICLNLKPANGTIIPAEGNFFTRASNGASADCTASTGVAIQGRTLCANYTSVGGIPNAVSTGVVDVSSCTIQFN